MKTSADPKFEEGLERALREAQDRKAAKQPARQSKKSAALEGAHLSIVGHPAADLAKVTEAVARLATEGVDVVIASPEPERSETVAEKIGKAMASALKEEKVWVAPALPPQKLILRPKGDLNAQERIRRHTAVQAAITSAPRRRV